MSSSCHMNKLICRSLFVLLYFYFWSLCCLFFFYIRIMITLWYLHTRLNSNTNCTIRVNSGALLVTPVVLHLSKIWLQVMNEKRLGLWPGEREHIRGHLWHRQSVKVKQDNNNYANKLIWWINVLYSHIVLDYLHSMSTNIRSIYMSYFNNDLHFITSCCFAIFYMITFCL